MRGDHALIEVWLEPEDLADIAEMLRASPESHHRDLAVKLQERLPEPA